MIECRYMENNEIITVSLSEWKNQKPVWVDCTNISKEERTVIGETFDIHPLTTEDLFNQNIRIKVEEFSKYIFCVFYASDKKDFSKLVETDFILGEDFIITNHKKKILSYEKVKEDKEKLLKIWKKGSDFLFHKLLDNEIDEFLSLDEKISKKIEKIDEEIHNNPSKEIVKKISRLRQELTTFRRIMITQRDKIATIYTKEFLVITKKAIPYFRDIYDHSVRVTDNVEHNKEEANELYDMYMSNMSNRMNEVMKTLSIIATIALPLTVVSGMYGTNFSVLPGSTNPVGFWIMTGVMISIILVMIGYFKKKKWF